ncbi:MAG: hypothetical protein ACYTE8_08030 [Planctomycetota bacterium]|jgi:hypothetical protein
MNNFFVQAIIIAGMDDEGSAFWAQILIFVLLGASWGVYNLVKKKRDEFRDYDEEDGEVYAKERYRDRLKQRLTGIYEDFARKHPKPAFEGNHVRSIFNSLNSGHRDEVKVVGTKKRKRNLQGGMEILDMNFLLSMVENIEGHDPKDIVMQKLCFDELIRRVRLDHINSQVLKVYAVNRDNMYGKGVQCEAMQELAERTAHHIHEKELEPALSVGV